MPTITEKNPQVFRLLQITQQRAHEALANGNVGNITQEPLPYWHGNLGTAESAVTVKDDLAQIKPTP